MRPIEITDATVGHWSILSGPHQTELGRAYWCKCVCGAERFVKSKALASQRSKSCGCRRADLIAESMTKHGHSTDGRMTRLYTTWAGMRQRCENPKSTSYRWYGARGISVCASWQTFEGFRCWALANGYADGLQIDRKDNNKGYCPDNCQWITDAENKRNTRRNRMVAAFGETKCIADWVADARCSVTDDTIVWRLRRGMTPEDAISTPRRRKPRS